MALEIAQSVPNMGGAVAPRLAPGTWVGHRPGPGAGEDLTAYALVFYNKGRLRLSSIGEI